MKCDMTLSSPAKNENAGGRIPRVRSEYKSCHLERSERSFSTPIFKGVNSVTSLDVKITADLIFWLGYRSARHRPESPEKLWPEKLLAFNAESRRLTWQPCTPPLEGVIKPFLKIFWTTIAR